jgi:hypothetical protein
LRLGGVVCCEVGRTVACPWMTPGYGELTADVLIESGPRDLGLFHDCEMVEEIEAQHLLAI